MLFLELRNSLRPKKDEDLPILGNVSKGITNLFMDLTGEVNGSFSITDSLRHEFGSNSLQILSTTACLSIMTGPLSVYEGQKKIKLSEKAHDIKGQILGWLQCARGGLRFTAGSLFYGMNIALLFTASKTGVIVGSMLKETGGALLGTASLFLSISASLLLGHAIEFRQKINAILETPDGAETALSMLKGELAKGCTGDLLHATRGACVEEVRHADLSEADAVMQNVLNENTKKIAISLLYFALSMSSAMVTFAAFFIAGENSLFGLAIIDTILGLIWLSLDVFGLAESLKDAEPGRYDVIWMLFTFVLSTVVVFSAAFYANCFAAHLVTLMVGTVLIMMHWSFFTQEDILNPQLEIH